MKCDRCSGRMIRDGDAITCINCGATREMEKTPTRKEMNVFEDARKSLEYALEQARQQLQEHEQGAIKLREAVLRLDAALAAMTGDIPTAKKRGGAKREWSAERRAAQAERMRARMLEKAG